MWQDFTNIGKPQKYEKTIVKQKQNAIFFIVDPWQDHY